MLREKILSRVVSAFAAACLVASVAAADFSGAAALEYHAQGGRFRPTPARVAGESQTARLYRVAAQAAALPHFIRCVHRANACGRGADAEHHRDISGLSGPRHRDHRPFRHQADARPRFRRRERWRIVHGFSAGVGARGALNLSRRRHLAGLVRRRRSVRRMVGYQWHVYGSRHLADKWARRRHAHAHQGADQCRHDRRQGSRHPAGDQVLGLAAAFGLANRDGSSATGSIFSTLRSAIEDDHLPFLKKGVNALDLIDFDYGPNNEYWHNEKDTMDKLSAHSFDVVGNVLVAVMRKL